MQFLVTAVEVSTTLMYDGTINEITRKSTLDHESVVHFL
jgi:hypothetical protein